MRKAHGRIWTTMGTEAQELDKLWEERGKQLDRAAKTGDVLKALIKPVWIIAVFVATSSFYTGQYVYRAQEVWNTGSPALKALNDKMDTQVQLLRESLAKERESNKEIIAGIMQNNALMQQRIEQVERLLERKGLR